MWQTRILLRCGDRLPERMGKNTGKTDETFVEGECKDNECPKYKILHRDIRDFMKLTKIKLKLKQNSRHFLGQNVSQDIDGVGLCLGCGSSSQLYLQQGYLQSKPHQNIICRRMISYFTATPFFIRGTAW